MRGGRITRLPFPIGNSRRMHFELEHQRLHPSRHQNGVFITVESTFAGVDALATLTVLLRVKTRHDDTTQTLGTYSYNYGSPDGMLPEREIGSTGKYAVPSPQIRAIFARCTVSKARSKVRTTSQAEEDGGIAPFHGFNFVLNLRMYSDL